MDTNLITQVLLLIKLRKNNPIIIKTNRFGNIYKYEYYIIYRSLRVYLLRSPLISIAEVRAAFASVRKTYAQKTTPSIPTPPISLPQLIAKVKHQWKRAKSDKSVALTTALLLIESSINSKQPCAQPEPFIWDKNVFLTKNRSPLIKVRQTVLCSEGILLLFLYLYIKRILL